MTDLKFLKVDGDYPSGEDIEDLFRICFEIECKVSTLKLIKKLASKNPAARLEFNLSRFLELAIRTDIDSILTEGIHPDERDALEDMQSKDLPNEYLVVLHKLLNLKERWILYKNLSAIFRKVRSMAIHGLGWSRGLDE